MSRARERVPVGYYESHHINPRCMGGGDEPSNIVALYPEEHFLAHLLLVKIHPDHRGLALAVVMMCQGIGQRPSRRLYGWVRRRLSDLTSKSQMGEANTQFGTVWITNGFKSRKIPKGIGAPIGWRFGRVVKTPDQKVNSLCLDCGARTGSPRRIRCPDHNYEFLKRYAEINGIMTRHRPNHAGRIYITDGFKDCWHDPEDPLPEGFVRGRSSNVRRWLSRQADGKLS
jgi:hypothetical protein